MNLKSAIRRIYNAVPVRIILEPICADDGISSRISSKKAGVMRYRVGFSDSRTSVFIGKRKSVRIILNGIRMLSEDEPGLFCMLVLHHKIFGYCGSVTRERYLYQALSQDFQSYIPHMIGFSVNLLRNESLLAMEELPSGVYEKRYLYPILDMLARLHAQYFMDAACVKPLHLNSYSPSDYYDTRQCLLRIFQKYSDENIEIFGREQTHKIEQFIRNIRHEWSRFCDRRTLTHNDCCCRNLSFSAEGFWIYDWELACYQNPEHDVAELLISVLNQLDDSEIVSALTYYKRKFEQLSQTEMSDAEYSEILEFNTLEYCVNKLSLLRLADKKLSFGYTRQLALNTARMLTILEDRKNKGWTECIRN